jgi:hypothetical protein
MYPPVRDKGPGEILRDMHKLVNNDPCFIILGQVVEMLGENFNNIMSRLLECQLPDMGKTPDAGPCPGGCLGASHTHHPFRIHIREEILFENLAHYFINVGSWFDEHRSSKILNSNI